MTRSSNRTLAGILAAVLALTVFAAGAGAKDFYKMSTLGPGSSPYLVMTTFANIINKKLPDVEIQVNATGVATRHAMETARGETDLFMTAPIIQTFMRKQQAMFKKVDAAPELATKLRSILMFPIGLYHVTVYADSGIETLEDIKGKKVFLGPPGGAALRVATQLVKGATGYEPGKDFESVKLGWDAAGAAFQDRRIDVYINPTNPPSPVIQQVALTNEIRFLSLSEAALASEPVRKLIERPGGLLGEIPAGVYGKNQVNDGPAVTIGAIVGIATRADMPDDVIYDMAKAFWEGASEMQDTAPWMREIALDKALDEANIPLHPGALRYYREAGLAVPERLVAK